jgi:hypothetical protein
MKRWSLEALWFPTLAARDKDAARMGRGSFRDVDRSRPKPRIDRLTCTAPLAYGDNQREGRIQSAERAVPTFCKTHSNETSFSLINADSRHSAKGASYA